jgi:hypothetical protein
MDCCFAAAAVAKLQGPLNEVVQQKTFEAFPGKGTSLLCASSAHDFASAPPELEYSVFSGSLLSVLQNGNPEIETSLSLYQIGRMVGDYIRTNHPKDRIIPEVHSPGQTEGEIAGIPIFPNGTNRPRALADQIAQLHNLLEKTASPLGHGFYTFVLLCNTKSVRLVFFA